MLLITLFVPAREDGERAKYGRRRKGRCREDTNVDIDRSTLTKICKLKNVRRQIDVRFGKKIKETNHRAVITN